MAFDVEHFHATTRYKTSVMTMLQYCRSFSESMKENFKKLSNWSAHYLEITVENTVSFYDIPQLTQTSTVKMSSKDQHILIGFSNVYG